MNIANKTQYRSEIDGLRAVAIVLVLLYHAGFGCSGGYIGVDVFFVISGFLITSLIWKDLQSDRFTFATFWERRARRIVPAFAAATIVTLAVGWCLLLPSDLFKLGQAAAAQALSLANVYYWKDSGYFGDAASEKPLLHTWSLAVEEQFYVVTPLIMWAFYRSSSWRHNRAALISLISIGTATSLILSVYLVETHPWAAFFLLPSRAWELSIGSLVSFLSFPSALRELRRVRETLALVGLVLILIPACYYTESTPFPGLAAIPPCVGTALIIWANERVSERETTLPTAVGRILSLQPVVFIGLISYSLYLWHWPWLAYSRYISITPLSVFSRLSVVGVSLLCAFLSWKYVETPFRTRHVAKSLRNMYAIATSCLALILFCGLVFTQQKGFPGRFDARSLAFADARTDIAESRSLEREDVEAGNIIRFGSDVPVRSADVFLWGDSHGMFVLRALDVLFKEWGLAGEAATRYGTAPIVEWSDNIRKTNREMTTAREYNQAVCSYIERHHFEDVIIVGCWGGYRLESHDKATFDAALLGTVRRLVAMGTRPTVVLDVPCHNFSPPKVLALNGTSDELLFSLCQKPTQEVVTDGFDAAFIEQLKELGARVIDPKLRFLAADRSHYVVHSDGKCIYSDGNHLSAEGAKLMLVPFFRDSLNFRNSDKLMTP